MAGPLAIFIILLDQLTKYWTLAHFKAPGAAEVELIPNIMYFVYVLNEGAAWGIMQGKMDMLAVISFAVFIFMFFYADKFIENENFLERKVTLGLLQGGIFGNFIDRANLWSRDPTGVIDFLSIQYKPKGWEFPAFNIADMAICTAVGIYILSSFIRGDQTKEDPPEDDVKVHE